MILYLHEFPSSEGIFYKIEYDICVIKFPHYDVRTNKYHTVEIKFKYCDIKIEIISISVFLLYYASSVTDLLLFTEPCKELMSIFHKYNHYLWAPTAQIPKRIISQFFNILVELRLNNPQ